MAKNTGARGLRSILESVLMEAMYEVCTLWYLPVFCYYDLVPVLQFYLSFCLFMVEYHFFLKKYILFLVDS